MSRVDQQFEDQRASNASGLPHFEDFRSHRERLTQLLLEGEPRADERLCVLGAGNAFDLELERLLARFAEVHLVDIDAAALGRARERVPNGPRSRLLAHAPLDLSGLFEHLERWGNLDITPQELVVAPANGAKRIAAALPGPFEVVASTCLLTQLQLALLQVLGDAHPLFVAVREFLTLTHLRTLAALTKSGGRALLITDLCDTSTLPSDRLRDDADLQALMNEMVATGRVIYAAHPGPLQLALDDDPVLKRAFAPAQLCRPWLWQNGPQRRFLVYALSLRRL